MHGLRASNMFYGSRHVCMARHHTEPLPRSTMTHTVCSNRPYHLWCESQTIVEAVPHTNQGRRHRNQAEETHHRVNQPINAVRAIGVSLFAALRKSTKWMIVCTCAFATEKRPGTIDPGIDPRRPSVSALEMPCAAYACAARGLQRIVVHT
jgi:hypothetical protein